MGVDKVKRYGRVIGLKPEAYEEYVRYHAAVWPEVLKTIHDCNIRNYSIFYRDNLLFSYFEYIGDDYAGDMDRMAANPKTREWWTIMDPMQQPVSSAKAGEWWSTMEEVFHTD